MTRLPYWQGGATRRKIACFVFGLVAMACYRRAGSLWPVGIAH